MTLQFAEERPPIPPADLILRVTPSFDPNEVEGARESFDVEAIRHLRGFERGLGVSGRSFADFSRLLDFGCGCGRFVRHFGALSEKTEIHGTDIDSEMIDWLRANVPFGRFELAPHEPPLPYPEHYFDLVINHSVFTHLDERMQDLWLGELQRVTQPGALLLLTVEGQSSWNRMLEFRERIGGDTEGWRSELESKGILFVRDDHFLGSTHPDFYHSTVHAPWYVFEHWSQYFDLVAYLPDGSDSQDLIVLKRRPDGAPAPRPISHRATQSAVPPANPTPAPEASASRLRALVGRLRGASGETASGGPPIRDAELDTIKREVEMLRAGLYEQANRMSVLGAQLRDEIETVKRQRS